MLCSGLLVLLTAAAALGQAGDPASPLNESAEARARLVPPDPADEPTTEGEFAPLFDRTDWVLELPGAEPVEAAPFSAENVDQLLIDLWMLNSREPAAGPEERAEGAILRLEALPDRAVVDPLRARTDRWATGLFSRDAELLTPLAPGREFLSWELTDRLTLSGVGGSRVWDYREREFVVSAEAGWQLSGRAGLHLGYEVLQASSASMSPDVAGESIFARFQLRF
jgi:hypothetical protein